MKRRWLVFLTVLLILINWKPLQAADSLRGYLPDAEQGKTAQIIWQRTGLGKLTQDPLWAPNNSLLLPLGNKLVSIDLQGKIKWTGKIASSGKMGKPVIIKTGSVFTAGNGLIQETKPNGVKGWDFSVVPVAKGLKVPLIAAGPDNILYMPLPDALYALDTGGHTMWIMSPWENSDNNRVKPNSGRTFLSCTGDDEACYVIYADAKASYKLVAISSQGSPLWSYWLGDVLQAALTADGEGRVYLSATFKPFAQNKSKLNVAKVFCFDRQNGKTPLWQSSFNIEDQVSAPVLSSDHTLYVTGGQYLRALNMDTGVIIWDDPITDLASPLAVDDKKARIYVGTSASSSGSGGGKIASKLMAVSKQGRMVWYRDLDGAILNAPLIGPDGYLYVCTDKGSLYKILDTYEPQ